jgi:glycosyltransferase 2 family protein
MSWRLISAVLGALATLLGIFLLYKVFQRYELDEIVGALRELPPANAVWAALCTVLTFAGFGIAEFLAVGYAKGKAPSPFSVLRVAVAALGIGHSIGLAALSSGAVRYRMYTRQGLDLVQVAKIVFFSGLTVCLGILVTASALILLRTKLVAQLLQLRPTLLVIIATVFAGLALAYPVLCTVRRRPIRLRRTSIWLPRGSLAVAQLAVGALNQMLIVATFYACLSPFTETGFLPIAALYVGADATAVVAHVPGGWGVLEYIVLHFLSEPRLIAGIVVFRAIYYLAPLLIGLTVFLADESMNMLRDRLRQRAAGDPLRVRANDDGAHVSRCQL